MKTVRPAPGDGEKEVDLGRGKDRDGVHSLARDIAVKAADTKQN
jgi:hypothetical protein